mmetsp:Transcript_14900/g.40761  ORF Transcript_14900/g.40761 Transcript_14900/m.40761 type:complete len:97 (-) Transcript_14900:40-330(-)
MGKVMSSMDLPKIQEIMDKFEKAFEDADVMSSTVTGAMESSTAMSTPASEVDDFLETVVKEQRLDNPMPNAGVGDGAAEVAAEEDPLAARLAALKR